MWFVSQHVILLVRKVAHSPGAVFTVIANIPGQWWVRIRNHHRFFNEGSEHIAYVQTNGDQPARSHRQKQHAGKGQSIWVTVVCTGMHLPHNRIHRHGDRRLCAPILWNQGNIEWLVSDHFQSPEGADVCPDWPQPPGEQLSTLGWRSLTSTRKPKPAERKWNKMSEGEQNRGHHGCYNSLNAVTHIKTSTYSNLELLFMFCAHFLCAPNPNPNPTDSSD